MKSALRWICVLPGAVLAMIAVNILNGITIGNFFHSGGAVDECSKAWFGSLAFICAAGYIAPKAKAITSIIIATAYCAIGSFAVFLAIRAGTNQHPLWLTLLTTIISLAASVCAAAIMLGVEKQDELERPTESQEK